MKSGLYDRDGASATARQAACANWFDGPPMNVSNVYRGLRPPGAGAGGGAAGCGWGGRGGGAVAARVSSGCASVGGGASSAGGSEGGIPSATNTSAAPARCTSASASERTTEQCF